MYEDWKAIKELLSGSERKIEIIEGEENTRASVVIDWAKIKYGTDLAAVIMNCEQIVVDDWVHVLGHGKGNDGQTVFILSSLPDGDFMKNGLVIATDILGGLFAICRDEKDDDYGNIFYLQPECLEWENSGMQYSEFLVWLAHDDLDAFYADVRWQGWRDIASRVGVDSALKFTPDVWMANCDFSASPRQIVPFKKQLDEELAIYVEDGKSKKSAA
jgi:hypothetical protein